MLGEVDKVPLIHVIKRFELVVPRVVTFSGVLATVAIFLMMAIMCIDIGGRYFLKRPLPGSVEYTEVLVVLSVYLAAATVQAKKQHIAFLLTENLKSSKAKAVVSIFGLIVALGIMALVAWQTGIKTYESISTGEYRWGTVQFPIWPGKLGVSLGSGLYCLQLLFDLIAEVTSLFKGRQAL